MLTRSPLAPFALSPIIGRQKLPMHPMQRANEDRVARERERIKNSLERRMKKLPPGQSAKINQLAGELKDLTDKELPAEVAKLTEKLDQVVNRINKG